MSLKQIRSEYVNLDKLLHVSVVEDKKTNLFSVKSKWNVPCGHMSGGFLWQSGEIKPCEFIWKEFKTSVDAHTFIKQNLMNDKKEQ
jgi:hypothetical protein